MGIAVARAAAAAGLLLLASTAPAAAAGLLCAVKRWRACGSREHVPQMACRSPLLRKQSAQQWKPTEPVGMAAQMQQRMPLSPPPSPSCPSPRRGSRNHCMPWPAGHRNDGKDDDEDDCTSGLCSKAPGTGASSAPLGSLSAREDAAGRLLCDLFILRTAGAGEGSALLSWPQGSALRSWPPPSSATASDVVDCFCTRAMRRIRKVDDAALLTAALS
mmetsp:Transcript_21669/g.46106  ORF Transcript_21669/g.46106 Transcript_21669/m.46106 type:complete len:217 (+) Transcript_21669:268-918(+)